MQSETKNVASQTHPAQTASSAHFVDSRKSTSATLADPSQLTQEMTKCRKQLQSNGRRENPDRRAAATRNGRKADAHREADRVISAKSLSTLRRLRSVGNKVQHDIDFLRASAFSIGIPCSLSIYSVHGHALRDEPSMQPPRRK